MSSSNVVAVAETVADFQKRNGIVSKNRYGRPTSLTWTKNKKCPSEAKEYGRGHITQIGNRKTLKTVTTQQIIKAIKMAKPEDKIIEIYPKVFCTLCSAPSWFFVDCPDRGHSTCTKCGGVNRIAQENISLHLNDDGVSNKNLWDITPGMTARDATLNRRGKQLGAKPTSHLRNY